MTSVLVVQTIEGRKHVILSSKKKEVGDAIFQAKAALQPSMSSPHVAAGVADAPANPRARRPRSKLALAAGALLALLVTLGAIGAIVEPKKKTTATAVESLPKTENPANDILLGLPESQQAVHLGHMVEEGCDGKRAFYMGSDKDQKAIWSVGCAASSSYQVVIDADAAGSTSVLDCRAVKALTDDDCFVTYDSQRGRPPRTRKQFMCAVARLPRHIKEKVLGQFIQNLQDYVRDEGGSVGDTKEQVLKRTLRAFERETRDCERSH